MEHHSNFVLIIKRSNHTRTMFLSLNSMLNLMLEFKSAPPTMLAIKCQQKCFGFYHVSQLVYLLKIMVVVRPMLPQVMFLCEGVAGLVSTIHPKLNEDGPIQAQCAR